MRACDFGSLPIPHSSQKLGFEAANGSQWPAEKARDDADDACPLCNGKSIAHRKRRPRDTTQLVVVVALSVVRCQVRQQGTVNEQHLGAGRGRVRKLL